MKEKRLRRSVSVALFHPLSQESRLRQVSSSTEGESDASASAAPTSERCNPYRRALLKLLTCGKDRFAMMGCLLIENFVRQDLSSCSTFFEASTIDEQGVEACASVMDLLKVLNIWDISTEDSALLVPVESGNIREMLAEMKLRDANMPIAPEGAVSRSNDLTDSMNAEEEEVGVDHSGGREEVCSGREAEVNEVEGEEKDFRAEMEEYTYGSAEVDQVASRGRGGSVDLDGCNHVGDALTVAAMQSLEGGNRGERGDGLVMTLFNILNKPSGYSLAVLQVRAALYRAISQSVSLRWNRLFVEHICADIRLVSIVPLRRADYFF